MRHLSPILAGLFALAVFVLAPPDVPRETAQEPLSAPGDLERPIVPADPSPPAVPDPPKPAASIPADLAAGVRARGPELHWADGTDVWLGRLLIIEAGPHGKADHAVMWHVLHDRRARIAAYLGRPVTLLEAVHRYAGHRLASPDTPRAQALVQLTDGGLRPPGVDEAEWRGWPAVLAGVRRWLGGSPPPDPCGGLAAFWGGRGRLAITSDAPRGSMEPLTCSEPTRIRVYSSAQTRAAYTEACLDAGC